MKLSQPIMDYIDQHREEAYQLLLELAQIPAPSNHEEKRAAFCQEWLTRQGVKGVYTDEACNVICPIGPVDGPLTVFMAHSDVVFPDTKALPLKVEDGLIKCPGVGDDTADVVALMTAAKFIAQKGLVPAQGGMLLVINSGEEGLGNLRGSRKIMETFGSRVTEFVTLDGVNYGITTGSVGSKRYRVEVLTEGGHSYIKFGNRNAIAYLASLIDTLYMVKVPEEGKTTYNVGVIQGGTSVNTIAQRAEMLYEVRSNRRENLAMMEKHLMAAVDFFRTKGAQINVELIGDRPCSGDVDPVRHQALIDRTAAAVRRHFGHEPHLRTASTDCNIPLSLGIPSVGVSCYLGDGAHTREEYIQIDSLLPGLRLCFELILHAFPETEA